MENEVKKMHKQQNVKEKRSFLRFKKKDENIKMASFAQTII